MTQGFAVSNPNSIVNQLANGGRLTLTSGLPVTTSDVTAATSVYFTPYLSGYISLYNSTQSAWVTLPFSEITISVPATTSTMYDVFAYISSGAVACETLAWTNDTTRATALALLNGIYTKSGDSTRRYIGSFRTTTVSGQTEDSVAKRYVWNYNNRVLRNMYVQVGGSSWTYSTASWRQANNSTTNQLDMVIGVSEEQVFASAQQNVFNSTATYRSTSTGIGVDSTSANSATLRMYVPCNNSVSAEEFAEYVGYPGAGRHYLAWLEYGGGADTQTWNGSGTWLQPGILGFLRG